MKHRQTAISMTVAAAIALTMSSTPSAAHNDVAKAVAGVVALGLLGAAVADNQHERGHEEYTAHPNLHADENAVGRCSHKAKRKVKKAGGYKFKVNHVNSVRLANDGTTHVSFVGTGYYDFGHKTSDIVCVVKQGKVKSFVFN